MNSRSAVILAAHPWNGIPYGLHHIARALARLEWRVLYIDPYFSPLHLLGGRRRGRVFGSLPRVSDEPGVTVLSPFTLAPHINLPLLRSRAWLHMTNHVSWPRISPQYLSRIGFTQPDLVVCGSPIAAEVALSLNAAMRLYRFADDSRLFDVLSPALRSAELDAIRRFDGVIATSSSLVSRAEGLGAKRVLLVSNGVDRAYFERPSPPLPAVAALPQPRILYAGAVESWFDWQLMIHAARARPNYTFVIVGRIGMEPTAPLPENIHLIGQRPYHEMPAFMQASHVGIIPFASRHVEDAIQAINPLKLYEYLAAGRPVVSSIRPPDLQCEGLFIYSGREEFLENLDTAIGLSNVKIEAPGCVDWITIVGRMLDSLQLTRGHDVKDRMQSQQDR